MKTKPNNVEDELLRLYKLNYAVRISVFNYRIEIKYNTFTNPFDVNLIPFEKNLAYSLQKFRKSIEDEL